MRTNQLTETGLGVLSLDPLSPVLREVHVSRQRSLGFVGVLLSALLATFGSGGTGSLLSLLGGLSLQKSQ
jgi:hypothetical protein